MSAPSHSAPVTPLAGTGRHLPALDGVRGLAILMVLVYHLMLFNGDTGHRWVDAISRIRGLGWMGVDLFFVLSGFLITGILYDSLHTAHFFRNFYMRRFLRIFPLYYGFLFILLLLTPVLHVRWGGHFVVLLAYLQNTGIWFPTTGFHLAPLVDLDHFWSLAVEEQFYIFWPLLVFLIQDRRRLLQTAYGLCACALIFRILLRIHGAPEPLGPLHAWIFCRMDTLLLGGILALTLRGDPSSLTTPVKKAIAWICFLGGMVTMLVAGLKLPDRQLLQNPFFSTFGYTLIAVAFVSLIFLAMQKGTALNRIFCMGWLRSLGKYSYGIYVLHILVGHLVGMAWHKILGVSLRIWLTPHLHSRSLAVLAEFAVTVSIVYCVAWLSFNLYEVHFLRMKRRFSD